MSDVIQALADLAETVTGVSEVLDNAFDQPGESPCAVVEFVSEKELDIQETGRPTSLLAKVSAAFAVRIESGRTKAAPARNQALGLAREFCRKARQDVTLGGACENSSVGAAQVLYAKWSGASWVLAQVEIETLYEETT